MIRLFTVLFFMLTSSAYAEDMTIDMLNKNADGERMVYSTEVARVAVGDTITWLPNIIKRTQCSFYFCTRWC